MERHEIEAEILQYQVREEVMANQRKAGLPTPPKPYDSDNLYTEWDNIKRRHGGVANIPFAELGDFLDKWTGLVSYARWVESIADIDTATAREIRDTIRNQLYMLQEGGRELRAADVTTEPLYREWEKKFTESQAMYMATKALREGYEIRANAISREITRRGNDMRDGTRGINRGQIS
ncbi:hypothetical protein [Peribacillus frigoritolerans]|uniref:Terminase small subunit n=1 Tax=Peribacillus castrilensis TaxID=2897690 RepID=A0AAW9NG58_9BACI|nr:hypothetical protein [Peribacillus castrilensis]